MSIYLPLACLHRIISGDPLIFQLLFQRLNALGQTYLAETEAVQRVPHHHDACKAEHASVMPMSPDMPPSRTHHRMDARRNETRHHEADRHVDEGDDADAPLAYVARRSGSSMALRRMKYAIMMSIRIRYVVRRGSHVHHTPHSNRVHRSPVIMVQTTNSSAISIAIFEHVSNRRFFVMRKRTAIVARERERHERRDGHRHVEIEDLLRQQTACSDTTCPPITSKPSTAAPLTGAAHRKRHARSPMVAQHDACRQAPQALSGRATGPLPEA